MQLPTLLVETLKSGKITISQNNIDAVTVNIQDKKIDANITDKNFVKDVLSSARKGSGTGGIRKSLSVVRESRPLIKEIAEDFCREGVTVTVSYKGDRVVTIGAEADSKLTRLVTGTKGVQINSARKLVELGV